MNASQDSRLKQGSHWQTAEEGCPSCNSQSFEKQIAGRAYQIWEGEGRPRGTELKNWLQAEAELKKAESYRVGRCSHPHHPRLLDDLRAAEEAAVDEAVEESFPASDPPAWTPAACT